MNVFLFELKAQLKSFIIWTAVLIIMLLVFMAGVFPIYKESANDITAIMQNFPQGFLEAFGFSVSTMFSTGGFYGFTYGYTGLVGAIMAVSIALSVFAREKKAKCVDFIMTKPVFRSRIFLYKLYACLAFITAANILYFLVSVLIFAANSDVSAGQGALAACSLYFTQLAFLSLGILLSVLFKHVRSIPGIAAAAGFSAFILNAMVNIIDEDWVRFFAPLKYFDAADVFFKGGFDVRFCLTGIILTALCFLYSYYRYAHSDIKA